MLLFSTSFITFALIACLYYFWLCVFHMQLLLCFISLVLALLTYDLLNNKIPFRCFPKVHYLSFRHALLVLHHYAFNYC